MGIPSARLLVWMFLLLPTLLHLYTITVCAGKSANTTVVPAPVSLAPSQKWDGNDGAWSSFAVQVGTPPQDVRILISSSGSSLWVVLPEGCTDQDPSTCPTSRGYVFNQNASSTWNEQGLFLLPLDAESSLPYSGNGLVGFDNITLGWQGSQEPSLTHQVITGLATKDFYLGFLGVTPRPVNISNFNDPHPSILETLQNSNQIPSASWSYTAGASYRIEAYGSLTLGGYDGSRLGPEILTVNMSIDISRDLVVQILSVTSGGHTLLPLAITAFIDSTVSQIWLPQEACQLFEDVFQLQWDVQSGLYLVNETLHALLLAQNASITFELGSPTGSGQLLNITLPYASFDLVAGFPLVGGNTTSLYFPLRRAANSSQYTLGRTFLQEAYLTVDYGRANFSISQPAFPDTSVPAHLIPILPPGEVPSPPKSTSLSRGALAGIVIGTVVTIAVIVAIVYFLVWKRKAAARHEAEVAAAQALTHSEPNPLNSDEKPELDAVATVAPKAELESPPPQSSFRFSPKPSQLSPASTAPAEMFSSPPSEQIRSWDSRRSVAYELPGTDVERAELGGEEVEGLEAN